MNQNDSGPRSNTLSKILGRFIDTTDRDPATDNNTSVADAGGKPATELERAVSKLDEIIAAKVKLQRLRTQEINKKETADQQIQELDSQRIEALTAYRIDGAESDSQRAEDLFRQIEKLKQNAVDLAAVAGAIDGKIAALDEEINVADRAYRIHLGQFFDDRMDSLVAEYNDLAPKFAQIVIDIDALYRVMIQYGTGNSNGWWRDARAPTIKPRDGRIYPPIMDTKSADFDSAAQRRVLELVNAFRETGFMWRYSDRRATRNDVVNSSA